MLKWIGGGKPDHPMADIKEARRLLAELPQANTQKSLEEITHWIESVVQTEGFHLGDRLEIIKLLDETGQTYRRKLARDYLNTPRLQKFQENRMWTLLFSFWKQTGDAYFKCVLDFEAGAKGAGAIKAELPLVVSRGLRAAAAELKWLQLRYGPVDEALWESVSKFYEFAETRGIAKQVVALYPGVPEDASAEREFLKIMMLWVSSPDGLMPLHIEIAERLIAHFSGAYVMGKARGDLSHCFDLAIRRPPMRLSPKIPDQPSLRFFSAGEVQNQLQQLIQKVEKTGLPAELNLGGTFNPGTVLEVLKHLALNWSAQPPTRKHERLGVVTRLTVVNGYDHVVDSLGAVALNFEGEESWVVQNISAGGFGAIIPQIKMEWIQVGMIIGIKPEGMKNWGVGIVRRISRDEQQQGYIGVQTLTKVAKAVQLRPLDAQGDSGAEGWTDFQPAALLSNGVASGEATLLMRSGGFASGQSFEMPVEGGKSSIFIPLKLLEQGTDYDLGKFRAMVRDQSEE